MTLFEVWITFRADPKWMSNASVLLVYRVGAGLLWWPRRSIVVSKPLS